MRTGKEKLLTVLSVLHSIYGVVWFLLSLPLLPYILAGTIGFVRAAGDPDKAINPSEMFSNWGQVILFIMIYLAWWALAFLIVLTGKKLAKRRSRSFCIVIAAIESLTIVPIGTLLGLFTILTLNKTAVIELFTKPSTSNLNERET